MSSAAVIKRTFAPAALVGHVYARERGATAAPMPIGNVLELELSHKEEVQTQPDMTQLGGGVHAEVRRVTDVEIKMKLADLNVTNLARASLGTVTGVEGGAVAGEAHKVTRGGMLRTAHIAPTSVVVRKGTSAGTATATDEEHLNVSKGDIIVLDNPGLATNVTIRTGDSVATATPLAAAGNYTVDAAGVHVDAAAPDVTNGKLDAATGGINSVAEAMGKLGMKSIESLRQAASEAQSAYGVIKAAGQQEGESYLAWQLRKQEAARAMLQRMIEANGGVADAATRARAAAEGLKLGTDESGRTIVNSMRDAKRAVEDVGDAAERAGKGFHGMAQEAANAANSTKRLHEIQDRHRLDAGDPNKSDIDNLYDRSRMDSWEEGEKKLNKSRSEVSGNAALIKEYVDAEIAKQWGEQFIGDSDAVEAFNVKLKLEAYRNNYGNVVRSQESLNEQHGLLQTLQRLEEKLRARQAEGQQKASPKQDEATAEPAARRTRTTGSTHTSSTHTGTSTGGGGVSYVSNITLQNGQRKSVRFTATWYSAGVLRTATDDGSGKFTGDATGLVDYPTRTGVLRPSYMPDPGATIQLAYSVENVVTDVFGPSGIAPDAGGFVNLPLSQQPAARTVSISWATVHEIHARLIGSPVTSSPNWPLTVGPEVTVGVVPDTKPTVTVVPFPPGWTSPPIPPLPVNVNWPRSS